MKENLKKIENIIKKIISKIKALHKICTLILIKKINKKSKKIKNI